MPHPPHVATAFPQGCQICDRDGAGVIDLCPDCRRIAEGVLFVAEGLGVVTTDDVSLDLLFADRRPEEMEELTGLVCDWTPCERRDASCLADLVRAVREHGGEL